VASGPAVPNASPSAQTSQADELIGQTLRATYHILESLDRGGMGVVYGAEHVRLRRRVAVKVLARHLEGDDSALARFQREADIVSRLVHPHIVQILDFDTTEAGAPYIVMELLSGESLADRLAREERLGSEECVRLAGQVASALAAAHAAGVVHRDLKPANIFLVNVPGQSSFVKLLDFGISKHTSSSALTGEFDILGTPDYMAPEQAMGRTALVDHRADQFSLAAITYEMLTTQPPFAAEDVSTVLSKVINDAPASLLERGIENAEAVNRVLQRAMSKQPSERFDTVIDFVKALAEAAECTLSIPPLSKALKSHAPTPKAIPAVPATDTAAAETLMMSENVQGSSPAAPTPDTTSRAIFSAIEHARLALGFEDLDLAHGYAESALILAEQSHAPEALHAIDQARTLFSLIYERHLGALDRRIIVCILPSSSSSSSMSPVHVFLISRIDGLTLEEALDISPLPRQETMRVLIKLLQRGVIELR
jgi:serine/threonine protein kinase